MKSALLLFLSVVSLANPSTVSQVDLEKYLGKWYEIKRIDAKFQKGCKNSTATYGKDGDEITIVNQCDRFKDGKLEHTKAEAKGKADDGTNSKLSICFFGILGICFGKGEYWIYDLGDVQNGQYSSAIVGSSNLKYGWILSRTPKLSDEKLKALDAKLKALGYKVEDFMLTEQTGH